MDNKEVKVELNYTKIPEKVVQVFKRQIRHELENANIYMTLSNWCENTGYTGSSKMYSKQADDERSHYNIFKTYLINRKIPVVIPDIPTTVCECKSLMDTLLVALGREKLTTEMISQMYEVCIREKDFIGSELVLKMLKEQEEEESKYLTYIDRLNIVGTCPGGLILIDQEFGA